MQEVVNTSFAILIFCIAIAGILYCPARLITGKYKDAGNYAIGFVTAISICMFILMGVNGLL